MAKVDFSFNFCKNCGVQNPVANKFCSRCGTLIQRKPAWQEEGVKCAACGYVNPRDAKFCIQCSSAISQEIIVIDQGDVTVVKVKIKKIDSENRKSLVPVFNRIAKKKIVIDLEGVECMDSTGIGTLVTQTYKSSRTNQETKIINVSPMVMEQIRALQVDNVLDIYETMDEARASWGLPLF
jgi:anti-anti-sigma factor